MIASTSFCNICIKYKNVCFKRKGFVSSIFEIQHKQFLEYNLNNCFLNINFLCVYHKNKSSETCPKNAAYKWFPNDKNKLSKFIITLVSHIPVFVTFNIL